MKYISKSLEETKGIALEFLKTLKPQEHALVVALIGDMGSGKTAFTQALGEHLGIVDSMQSPTFVIEKIYPIDYQGFKKLIHLDAYRLEKDAELIHLGWEEIMKDPENLILIEWPIRVASLIPKDAKEISFKFVDLLVREIEVHEK